MKQKLLHFTSHSAAASLFFGLIATGIAHAQGFNPAPNVVSNVGQLDTNLFCPVIYGMFWVLMSVSVIMVLWAAYTYLTAGEDTEKVHKATKTLTYAAVAIVVALIALAFPDIVGSVFSAATPTASSLGSC